MPVPEQSRLAIPYSFPETPEKVGTNFGEVRQRFNQLPFFSAIEYRDDSIVPTFSTNSYSTPSVLLTTLSWKKAETWTDLHFRLHCTGYVDIGNVGPTFVMRVDGGSWTYVTHHLYNASVALTHIPISGSARDASKLYAGPHAIDLGVYLIGSPGGTFYMNNGDLLQVEVNEVLPLQD